MPSYYKNVQGWFDWEPFYDEMVDKFKDDGYFVEVGVWLGASACYLVEKIAETKANIIVDFVDNFLGDPYTQDQPGIVAAKTQLGMYQEFYHNILKANPNWSGTIHMEDSVFAARFFKDESLDMVFLDSAHNYQHVSNEISSWLPKVKVGGVLCGHDYRYADVGRAIAEKIGPVIEKVHNTWCYLKEKP